jgi:hypothetical protein
MAHYHLARMLLHLQQADLGREHLLLALKIDPTLELAQKLLAQTSGRAPTKEVQQVGYQEAPAPPPSEPPPSRPLTIEVRAEPDTTTPTAMPRVLPPPPSEPPPSRPLMIEVRAEPDTTTPTPTPMPRILPPPPTTR